MNVFPIGTPVYVARLHHTRDTVPCPVCFGNKIIHIILGDSSVIEMRCEYCLDELWNSRGWVYSEYYQVGDAEYRIVTGFDVSGESEVRYRFGGQIAYADHVFLTREEAMEAALVLMENYNEEEEKRRSVLKHNALKSYSWHVGYHQRTAKQALKDYEYHSKMAVLCQEKVRK